MSSLRYTCLVPSPIHQNEGLKRGEFLCGPRWGDGSVSWLGTEPVRPLRTQGGLRYSESPPGGLLLLFKFSDFPSGVKMIKTPKWQRRVVGGRAALLVSGRPAYGTGLGAQHMEWAPLGAGGAGRRHPPAETHPGKGTGVDKPSTTTGVAVIGYERLPPDPHCQI